MMNRLLENIAAATYLFLFFCAMILISVSMFLAAAISLLLFAMIATLEDIRSRRVVYFIIFIVILGSVLSLWIN